MRRDFKQVGWGLSTVIYLSEKIKSSNSFKTVFKNCTGTETGIRGFGHILIVTRPKCDSKEFIRPDIRYSPVVVDEIGQINASYSKS